MNNLTPVPEEDDQEFIFTITNSRGEIRNGGSQREQREPRTTNSGPTGSRSATRNTNLSRDKLTDAQRVGTDAPPSYDQVVTETRNV